MSANTPPPTEPPADLGFRHSPAWLAALLGIAAVQGVLTVAAFGDRSPTRQLLDDQPIVSGRHALHLYHGRLGAWAWVDRHSSCCYDPAFHAGYPKTPLFDQGSRPAELFILCAGDGSAAAAYKVGLALCCVLAPLAFAGMARGVGMGPGRACLAAGLGALAWWTPPIRRLIEAGDLDLLIGGMAGLLNLTWLARFARRPGIDSWLVLLATACLGWFAHPILWAAFLPLALVYYVLHAARRGLAWHLALAAVTAGGLVANVDGLLDWGRYAWIRLPVLLGDGFETALPELPSDWHGALAAGEVGSAVALLIAAGGLVGMAGWCTRSRGAVFLLGGSAIGLMLAVAASQLWPPLRALGLEKVTALALACAVCPCAATLARVGRSVSSHPRLTVALSGTAVVALAMTGKEGFAPAPVRAPRLRLPQLTVGLDPDRQALVHTLSEQTTAEARILWEDRPQNAGVYWTPLLPLLTGRAYLGGLDPEGCVEHAFARLADGSLAGRPLAEWADAELERFCERYNVGWVVCWTPEAVGRFGAWPRASVAGQLSDGGAGVLYAIERKRSFILKGKGRWLQADTHRVALAEVEPEDGVVILSLHYQAGWRVAPSDVVLERDPDPEDPIPLVRLRLNGPVARLTLTWDDPVEDRGW
jgi:hypothetical protein